VVSAIQMYLQVKWQQSSDNGHVFCLEARYRYSTKVLETQKALNSTKYYAELTQQITDYRSLVW